VIVLLALSVVSLPVGATEPFGRVELVARWIDPPAAGEQARIIRVEIRPRVTLDGVELVAAAPSGLALRVGPAPRAVEFRELTRSERGPALSAQLEQLTAGETLTVEFEVVADRAERGPLVISVTGQDGKGRPVREAIGVSIPHPNTGGTRRLGAIEFPAQVLPRDGSR